ncbi:hypothetical protein [Streptomyces sp. ISL-94]|uniref:hypothetical protein n=1 Tax=Streptomyces sp. ISL-94 TaxID=2819190 RepID=UPI001BE7D02F|nr:hypothetical protein [Streptomyces sp. ISL-94]MBT2480364.1 hypothetical protein [Streptomyces sp. ISL-94]
MPERNQTEGASGIAHALLKEVDRFDRPTDRGFAELVHRFSRIEFEVPEASDSDGYLWQYGPVDWFPEPTFVCNVIRQLEVADSSGEHECYVHVQFEFRYQLDKELENVGSGSKWWFPEGEETLNSWLDSLMRTPAMNLLALRIPREFEISQDYA